MDDQALKIEVIPPGPHFERRRGGMVWRIVFALLLNLAASVVLLWIFDCSVWGYVFVAGMWLFAVVEEYRSLRHWSGTERKD